MVDYLATKYAYLPEYAEDVHNNSVSFYPVLFHLELAVILKKKCSLEQIMYLVYLYHFDSCGILLAVKKKVNRKLNQFVNRVVHNSHLFPGFFL